MMSTNIHLSDGEMGVSTSKVLNLYSLTITEVEASCNVTAFLTLDQMKQIKNELTVSINYFEKEIEVE